MDASTEVKILLVDDQPANLLALEAVLDPLHYGLVKAHSGPKALEILKVTDISLVILDVHMPTMDGFETAKLIQQQMPGKKIPIIFMTAVYKEDPYIHKGFEVGGVDYFGKPFDPAVLKAKVRFHAEMYRQTKLLQQLDRKAITYGLTIGAPPARVWQGLTDPPFTKQYWAGQYFESEWKVGFDLKHRMPDGGTAVWGKILAADEPKILSYSWKVDLANHPASGILTTVTFTLTPFHSTTALMLVHEGYSVGTKVYSEVAQVWQVVLCGLKTLLETGEPMPFDWKGFLETENPRLEEAALLKGRAL